jgi:hypothetical protein
MLRRFLIAVALATAAAAPAAAVDPDDESWTLRLLDTL